MKYLKVDIEGCHVQCGETIFVSLDPVSHELGEYTDEDLTEIAQETVNEYIGGWGHSVVDESEVPEGMRR